MNTPTIEPITLSIEEELESALVKVNVTDLKIQELIDRARPHAKPIENEEQYLAAEKARKEIKVVRLLGEKGIERVDRHYLDLRQASLAKKKELLERINEPEAMILPFTKEWERKKEEEEKERQRQIEAMKEERKATIQGLGFIFVPGPPEHRYVLGETTIPVRDIVDADHETWMTLLKSATMVSEEVAQARAEEERLQQERQRRLEEQEKQQREAAEAIARQQAEIDRRQRELDEQEARARDAANKALNETRKNELLTLGLEVVYETGEQITLVAKNQPSEFRFLPHSFNKDFYKLSDSMWSSTLNRMAAYIRECDTLRQEAEATALKRIEEEAARREQQEKERQAKLGDADRWLEWTASIKLTAPEMQSAIAQHAVKRVLAGLDAMQPNVLNDLK